MRILVHVSCVDGTYVETGVFDAEGAKAFITKHDHEGAVVDVKVEGLNDEAYLIINSLLPKSADPGA